MVSVSVVITVKLELGLPVRFLVTAETHRLPDSRPSPSRWQSIVISTVTWSGLMLPIVC